MFSLKLGDEISSPLAAVVESRSRVSTHLLRKMAMPYDGNSYLSGMQVNIVGRTCKHVTAIN